MWVSGEKAGNYWLWKMTRLVGKREVIAHGDRLMFQVLGRFVAMKLHRHAANWAEIATVAPTLNRGGGAVLIG